MIERPDDVHALVGRELGPTSAVLIDQARIDAFAEITEDPQWIHVDPVRAAAGPFGSTIAHGYLTLSLVARGLTELLPLGPGVVSINYGLDRVRFPSPVPVGSRVSMTVRIGDLRPVTDGVEFVARCTLIADGAVKPACVADAVLRYLRAPA